GLDQLTVNDLPDNPSGTRPAATAAGLPSSLIEFLQTCRQSGIGWFTHGERRADRAWAGSRDSLGRRGCPQRSGLPAGRREGLWWIRCRWLWGRWRPG